MKKYDNKPISEISWTKYKIIVPTEEDKNLISNLNTNNSLALSQTIE